MTISKIGVKNTEFRVKAISDMCLVRHVCLTPLSSIVLL